MKVKRNKRTGQFVSTRRGNKNPVRRRGNLVVVSGPHSHAYPARKTRIQKNPRGTQRVIVRKAGPHAWSVLLPSPHVPGGVPYGRVEERDGKFYYSGPTSGGDARYPARSLSSAVLKMLRDWSSWIGHDSRADFAKRKREGRNPGMGVSDLVMTPAYGAFGGAIREGKYVGGPMQWRRRGIGNPGKKLSLSNLNARADKLRALIDARVEKRMKRTGESYTMARFGPDANYPEDVELNHIERAITLMLTRGNKNPLVHGYSRSSFGKNVKRERGRGVGKQRALAIAFSTGRRAAKKAGVRMPKFLRRNPLTKAQLRSRVKADGGHFFDRDTMRFFNSRLESNAYGPTSRGTYYFVTSEQYIDSLGQARPRTYKVREWMPGNRNVVTHNEFSTKGEAVDHIRHVKGIKNPRYRQSPPGAPSLAATRATQWRALGTSFPGAIIGPVDARGNPRRRKKNKKRNPNIGTSFWRATIYSPTGKPIHRQVIRNTRAGALASAKALARKNPKVALDGPYKSAPAC